MVVEVLVFFRKYHVDVGELEKLCQEDGLLIDAYFDRFRDVGEVLW